MLMKCRYEIKCSQSCRSIFTMLFTAMILVNLFSQQLYFPPQENDNWQTISPDSLNWCPDSLASLIQYLEDKDTKAFVILKNGKLAVEWYGEGFGRDSIWYWASAAKSLTAMLVGIAQEEGYVSLENAVSDHLGSAWTSCTLQNEQKITIKDQLKMTSGLDDGVQDNHCTLDTCLQCIADPGTRWAYHNAPYTLIREVLEAATSMNINLYYWSRIASKIDAGGLWIRSGYNNLMLSKALDMARYGLLVLSGGQWDGTAVLSDTNYFNAMLNTSQPLNKSYGYLWWLNGKGEYMLPGLQTPIPRDLIPNAPDDLIAALGKNDQKIYIVPSEQLVVVRMGEAAGLGIPTLSGFDNALWDKLSSLDCFASNSDRGKYDSFVKLYPNPAIGRLRIETDGIIGTILISDIRGNPILSSTHQEFDISTLKSGLYIAMISFRDGRMAYRRFIKL